MFFLFNILGTDNNIVIPFLRFLWDSDVHDEVRFVLDQQAELDSYCASSLRQ
jgi:hypothetical protein